MFTRAIHLPILHKSSPPIPIMSQTNPVHNIQSMEVSAFTIEIQYETIVDSLKIHPCEIWGSQ
jgi:hypothetical protein